MIFRQLFDQKSSTYTYLLGDKITKQSIIIDPVLDKLNDYLILLNNLNLSTVPRMLLPSTLVVLASKDWAPRFSLSLSSLHG